MIQAKQIGMAEIFEELGMKKNNENGIYHFDIKDEFFVGRGCEKYSSVKQVLQPTKFKNISICSEV